MPETSLPSDIELHRDKWWRREPDNRVEDVHAAEQFIDAVGFCSALTDVRRDGPSLFIAVCGRRDAHLPRNVQKDPESRLTWTLKDELMSRGKVFYAKLTRGRSTFVSRRLIPCFHSLWGIPKGGEARLLSPDARTVLRVMRREWEMGTRDLQQASRITERPRFVKALDELQRTLMVIPGEALYQPKFTYIWTLAEGRFPEEMAIEVARDDALREIARAFLSAAGMTARGELARVTGLSAPDAGVGNWALVDEGFAMRLKPGVYRLKKAN
jgi:hypothetical protein